MSDHYDALETRSADQRERDIFAALPAQIAHAKARAPAFARIVSVLHAESGPVAQ